MRVFGQISSIAISITLFVFTQSFVSAQQQTTQTIPATRNPQTNNTELFSQQQGLQSTGSDQILKNQQSILIPAGRPLPPPSSSSTRNNRLALLMIGLTGVVLSTLAIVRFGRKQSQPLPTPEMPPEPVAQEATNSDPKSQDQKPQKKKRNRKRKKR